MTEIKEFDRKSKIRFIPKFWLLMSRPSVLVREPQKPRPILLGLLCCHSKTQSSQPLSSVLVVTILNWIEPALKNANIPTHSHTHSHTHLYASQNMLILSHSCLSLYLSLSLSLFVSLSPLMLFRMLINIKEASIFSWPLWINLIRATHKWRHTLARVDWRSPNVIWSSEFESLDVIF